MLRPAARLRAFAGALCCALILAAAITHQARADDAPGRAGEFARAWRIASPAPQRHVPRVRVHALEASRLGRAWGASHPLVRTALADLGRGKFTAHPGPWCADALVAWAAAPQHPETGARMTTYFGAIFISASLGVEG